MGEILTLAVSVMLVMAVCGTAGYNIARDQGRNPFMGLALGAALPLIGVGALWFLGRKLKR